MRKAFLISFCILLVTGLATPATTPVPFSYAIIDSSFTGDCKGVGDIDGDGFPDVVVGGSRLVWYRYPNWTRTVIANANVEFTTDMQVGDVNGDGAPDIIVPDGPGSGNLLWFQNPRPGGDPATSPWTRRVIGTQGDWIHDLEVGDINGDGKLDVVTRKDAITRLWLQNSPTSWTMVNLSSVAPPGEGVALADIDRDGDLDLVVSGRWMETPADPVNGAWVARTIDAGWPDLVGVAVGDINQDGRVDVLFGASESTGSLSWYEAPANPRTGAWIGHVIDNSVDFVHTFKTADINKDGNLDVVFAEMAQSSRRRVGFYLNGGNGTSWVPQVLATTGSHNIRVADIGSDGDIDIVGANWQGPPVEMWENQLAGVGNRPPVAANQSVTTTRDTPIAITLSATDPDGNPFTYSIVTGPAHGSLTGVAPAVTYTPAVGYTGPDSFTFKANDGLADSNVATVSITVIVPPDTTPPSVSISAPANGQTVSGTITISANASDNVGVVGVQFLLDGANLGAEDITAPYSISWNTTTVGNGSHSLSARARDAAGNTATAASITVTVSNSVPDTTPPSVSISSPANGQTVSGTITISANASDNVGVVGVQFLLDGANLGVEDTIAPYAVSWNTAAVSNGSHTVAAVARDAAGNSTTASVTVQVSNGGTPVDTRPGSVVGAGIDASTQFRVEAEDLGTAVAACTACRFQSATDLLAAQATEVRLRAGSAAPVAERVILKHGAINGTVTSVGTNQFVAQPAGGSIWPGSVLVVVTPNVTEFRNFPGTGGTVQAGQKVALRGLLFKSGPQGGPTLLAKKVELRP